jgi:class 3 adenylate cyclase
MDRLPTPDSERSATSQPPARAGRHIWSAVLPSHERVLSASIGPDLYAIVQIDLVGSARATGRGQHQMREGLYDLVDRALGRRQLGLHSFPLDDTGDGLRFLVPFQSVRPTDIIDTFVLGLLAELRLHRRFATNETRLRLRVAFDLGIVEPHLNGWAGESLVRVARLVDAEPVRDLFRSLSEIDLVAIVSDLMYHCLVRPATGYIAADCFRPVYVHVKEFEAWAWLLVPQAHWLCGSCGEAA